MVVKIIFLVVGIIFYALRALSKNKKATKSGTTSSPARAKSVQTTRKEKPKSIDDIFNDFVKEVENSKKKKEEPAKPIFSATKQAKVVKKEMDWQKVEKTHIVEKKQLIDHENYHGVSHRIDDAHQIMDISEISDTEGEVFNFDVNEIDWKSAIIAKEILDRKFA